MPAMKRVSTTAATTPASTPIAASVIAYDSTLNHRTGHFS
jgi:hypothetical protein